MSARRYSLRQRIAALCGALVLVALPVARVAAQPATFLVGSDNCDFATIQPALDAAGNHPGPDLIHIATNATYTAQALRMNAQDVEVAGGYASCASPFPTPGSRTTISGTGGAADSVLVILGDGIRTLRDLNITGGDESDDDYGGGIDFEGAGSLRLDRVGVSQNRAGFGGGINFQGSSGALLVLGEDVIIQNNVAAGSGGGVRIAGESLVLMRNRGSTITGNEALGLAPDTGYGGGVELLDASSMQIASGGAGNIGAIAFNRAKYGGGIGMPGSEEDGGHPVALLFTTDPQRPGRVHDNVATIAGGGAYVGVVSDFDDLDASSLCGYEFRIDHNRAPNGAALYFESQVSFGNSLGANGRFNVTDDFECGVTALPLPAPAVRCAPDVPCNLIDSNVVQQENGTPADGAVVYLDQASQLRAARVALVGNSGNDLILARPDADAPQTIVDFDACLIADNVLGARVLSTEVGSLRNCTIAGNAVGFSSVVQMTGNGEIRDSIIWQPGSLALDPAQGSITGGHVLTNDPSSLPPFDGTVDDHPPRFVDAARGDYRLRFASPAVDFAPALPGNNDFDLDGVSRDIDMPIKANAFGPRDVGAYERHSLLPLVLNGEFDRDLNLWSEVTPAISTFDAADNAVGPSGSGSLKVDWNNSPVIVSRVSGRVQCVHLPGPGTYRLNGNGHTSGSLPPISVQTAALAWEFRRDGGEACNAGPATSTGELNLTSGVAWVEPATPATITVSALDYTANSSIQVTTVVKSGGTTIPPRLQGWFDGITLAVVFFDPFIFADGFE